MSLKVGWANPALVGYCPSMSQMFDAYVAVSPSLWWDDQRLAKQAEGLMKIRKKGTDPRLYLAIANEGGDMQHGMDRVVRALHGRKNWCYTPRKAMRHDTIRFTARGGVNWPSATLSVRITPNQTGSHL